jgi:hypothetical protein
MDTIRPASDFRFSPEWRWPGWKLGMDFEDLFTTLHQQYNIGTIPVQDFEAFITTSTSYAVKPKPGTNFISLWPNAVISADES